MAASPVSQESIAIYSGGQSQQVAITAASASSTAITGSNKLYICATVDCFVRQGATPTALATGVDQFIPAYTPMRIAGFTSGNKVACITTGGSGYLYITPEI